MTTDVHQFDAEVWRWQARQDGWFFVTLPEEASDHLDERSLAASRGFGSVPVEVLVGTTRWRTSVFPDAARGAFVLPLKKSVRTAEGIEEGATISVTLHAVA